MTEDSDTPKSSTETMAELVAKKKAAQGQGRNPTASDDKARRAAAARSASKSKPALRK
jgi:hypothetical protein